MSKTVVVLGARNLGGAIIDHFLELGWSAAGVARSEDTLARVRDRGALAVCGRRLGCGVAAGRAGARA